MQQPRSSASDRLIAVAVACAVFAGIWLATRFAPTAMNNYVLVADAWLHGRSWVTFPGDWIDAVPYHGRAYIVEAPWPALLMLPFVAMFGLGANQVVLAAALAAVAAAAVYRAARSFGDARLDALILTVFALLGTDLLYAGMNGDVWLVAHLSAFAFTLLALGELNGARRLWLVTLFGLAAALSRYPLAVALPVYAWLLRDQIVRLRSLIPAAAVGLPIVVLWSVYNWSRWRTPWDPGFTIWYHVMDPRARQNASTLSLSYLPRQLHAFFFEPPAVSDGFPWLEPLRFGNALTFTSFGLAVAFAVRARDRLVVPLIVLTLLAAGPAFLYYDTGGVQFGVRHALDFEPFLIALIASSLRHPPQRWKRVLLLASSALGAYLLYVWSALHRIA